MYVEKFQQNEKIFNRGDEGDTFFVILKGEVAVVREEEGKEVIVVTLGVGACFGELSLLDGRPRTATMVCVTDTTCAVLSKDDYTNLLLSAKKEQLERKVEFLAQHPFFSGWSRMALNRVSYHFELETFKGGSMIYQEGDKAEKVYFIQAGEFRFEKLQIIQQYKEKDAKWLKKPFKLRRFQSRPRYQISIRSEKQIFGDDEVIERVPRRQTAIWNSTSASAYVIWASDFLKRLNDFKTWNKVMEFHEVEKDYRKQRFRSLLRADRIKESLSTNKILDLKPQNMTVATPPPDQLVKPDLQSTTVDIRVKFKPKKVKPKRNNSVYAIFKNVIKSSHSHSPIRAPTPIREVTPPRLKQSNYKPPASFFATPEDAINRRYKGRLAILDKSPRDQYRTPSDPRVRHIRAQKVLRCRTPSPPKRSPRQV